MSKGSTGRPFSVTNEEYANRWDAIFGRDNEKKNQAEDVESNQSDSTRDNRSINNPEGQTGQTQDA